ncbi:MAG: hypothetical protein ACYC3B_04100 [Sedimentisphaerales bacterium]
MRNEFENLQRILEQQIAFAQLGRIDRVDALLKQADSAIGSFAGVRELPANINRLYNELCLILKANMAGVKTALKQSKKSKLAARTYRRNG